MLRHLRTLARIAARATLLAAVLVRLRALDQLQHRRLEAAEAEIIGIADPGARQPIRVLTVACLAGRAFDSRAAGIAKPQQARHLIERLTGGVVACLTQQ